MKRFKIILLAAAALFITVAAPVFVKAGEAVPSTHGTVVGFQPGYGAVPPLDPDDPAKENTDPNPGAITGQSDALTLDLVPSISFGSAGDLLVIDHKKTDYPATGPARPYIQISDLRGTGAGWKLTVSASRFVNTTAGGVLSLEGAELRFAGGNVRSSNSNAMNDSARQPFAADPLVIKCTGNPGDVATVLTAPGGGRRGMGAWILRFYQPEGGITGENPDIALSVPKGKLTPGLHKATLTWTLHNAP